MKVTLENFGPIKRVEFDLTKNLNVIFGENNIGKSYAITSVYIILKHLLAEFGGGTQRHMQKLLRGRRFVAGFDSLFQESENQVSPLIDVAREVQAAFKKDTDLHEYDLAIPMAAVIKNVFSFALQDLISNSFNNSFQSIDQLPNGLSKEPLLITIDSSQFALSFHAKNNSLLLENILFKQPFIAKKSKRNLQTTITERGITTYFKISSVKKNESSIPIDIGQSAVFDSLRMILNIFSRELRAITYAIYFLPASRSGLYQALSTFGVLFAELSKSRNFLTKGVGVSLPTITEPVADYFLRLSNMKPTSAGGAVATIAQQIEQQVLGGEVEFDEQTKKLFFMQRAIDHQMDLSFTSSMISEIAPIVAHLKYILRQETIQEWGAQEDGSVVSKTVQRMPSSLIFIEEPEAHLHPKVQVKLMEFFARLTKHNVKIIMTSHSNYMFNKLSNLLLQGELEPEKVGSYLMRATPEGSVMDAVAMRAEEDGIMDENFVDVAEQLYNERLAAYDKLNAHR